MNEKELRLHRCCFTGHRPEKMTDTEDFIMESLRREIKRAIRDGYKTFISGMARGVDIWAGEIVLELRDSGLPIHLIAASPYRGFEERWSREWQERYTAILRRADLARFICPRYSRDSFQRRNEWMVDHSTRIIAVYNGKPGGTQNTIEYAKSRGVYVALLEGEHGPL